MQFTNVRLLVSNFEDCFHFYRDTMGFIPQWGDEGSTYATFKTGGGITLALFRRNLMAEAVKTDHLPDNIECQDRFALILVAKTLKEQWHSCDRRELIL